MSKKNGTQLTTQDGSLVTSVEWFDGRSGDVGVMVLDAASPTGVRSMKVFWSSLRPAVFTTIWDAAREHRNPPKRKR